MVQLNDPVLSCAENPVRLQTDYLSVTSLSTFVQQTYNTTQHKQGIKHLGTIGTLKLTLFPATPFPEACSSVLNVHTLVSVQG